jgi:hypothetical protein
LSYGSRIAPARKTTLLVGVVLLAACGSGSDHAAHTGSAPTQRHDERVVIRDLLTIAALPGSEPIATGTVLPGSTLEGAPFCAGGTLRDTHASADPAMKQYLVDRTITCPDGTVRIGLRPKVPFQGMTQTGSWTIVSGTGAFAGLHGSGRMAVKYTPNPKAPAHETLTGTASR